MIRFVSRHFATLELTAACLLWAFAFIVVRFTVQDVGPFWLTGLRFSGAFICALPLILLNKKLRALFTSQEFLQALPSGLFLGLCLLLQNWGLKYTTATNSGFLTCLYVLFIPLIETFILKKKISPVFWGLVFVAFFGMGLISQIHNASTWNVGDLLTVGCAMAATGHVLSIAHFAPRIQSPLIFNALQSFWAGLLGLVVAAFTEPWSPALLTTKPLVAIAYLILGPTLVAFAIQVKAQRVLSPSTASMIFLLEAPITTLFAFLLLGETLAPLQWLGAGLISAAVFGVTRI